MPSDGHREMNSPIANAPPPAVWQHLTPAVFVVLWSTGFIGAKYGLPYAEPFTFLLLRFAIVSGLLLLAVPALDVRWPHSRRAVLHIVIAGLLVHGVYLGGVFAAIDRGISAGVSALTVGVQPLLTALAVGPLLGERVSAQQWLGLGLGFAGLALVVWRQVDFSGGDAVGFAFCIAALVGMTAGTLYHKRFCSEMDLRAGALIQYAATALFMLCLASAFESRAVTWSRDFVLALGWAIVVLSLGAVFLLYVIIRRGAAARVASLFYLVPPVTALLAYLLFGETLGAVSLLGMAMTVIGVALVNR